MARIVDNYSRSIAAVEAHTLRRRNIEAEVERVTRDPNAISRINTIARAHPGLSGGVARALGQERMDVDHPVVRFAVTQEMLRNHVRGVSWANTVGDQQRRRAREDRRPEGFLGVDMESIRAGMNPFTQYDRRGQERDLGILLTLAEKRGMYDPATNMLIEPQPTIKQNRLAESAQARNDPDGDFSSIAMQAQNILEQQRIEAGEHDPGFYQDENEDQQLFRRLQDLITGLTGLPVTYLSTTGQTLQYDPQSGLDFPADPVTGEIQENVPDPANLALSEQLLADIYHRNQENAAIRGTIGGVMDANSTQQAGMAMPDPGGLRNVLRPVLTAFDAPVQEVQGQVRNLYALARGDDPDWFESQSDAGIALERLLTGEGADLGQGFLTDPDSAVARERRIRERERGEIGGHSVTLGRIVADTVTEPDTTPFRVVSGMVDAGVQLADPTAFGLGKARKWSDAMRTFQPDEAAGMLRGVRRYVHGPTFDSWANNQGQLFEALAKIDDPYEIGKLTNFKLGLEQLDTLANIPDAANIRNYLRGQVSRGRVRYTTQFQPGNRVSRLQYSTGDLMARLNPQRQTRGIRLFSEMPSTTWDMNNPDEVGRNLIRTLQNAHVPESDIRDVFNMAARSRSRNGLFTAINESQRRVGGSLEQYGIADPRVRDELTRTSEHTYNEHLRGLIDDVGADVPTWTHMAVDGSVGQVPGPHLPLEHIGRYYHTPDPRAVRRLTTRYKFLTASNTRDHVPVLKGIRRRAGREEVTPRGQQRLPLALYDHFMNKFVKPAWLLRAAWPMRVVGEEQLRMSTAGLDSAFSGHPISWLAIVIGNKGNISPDGTPMEMLDALSEVTYRAHGSWLDNPGAVRTNNWAVFTKSNPHELADFEHAWANELALLAYDPVSNHLLHNTVDATTDWLWSGSGRKYRRELTEAHPHNLLTRQQVHDYVLTVGDRHSRLTGSDPEILDAIRTNKFKGRNGREMNIFARPGQPELSPNWTKWLQSRIDLAPEKVKGTTSTRIGNYDVETMSRWDQGVEFLMHSLMGVPTSKLSRSPAFKQFLWKRAAELMPYADAPTQQAILANARRARLDAGKLTEYGNLNRTTIRNLERQASRGTGTLSMDELMDLAKAYAIDDTTGLLYDLSKKSQAADILRQIIPFGEAFKEVWTTWANLASAGRGPLRLVPGKPIRRAQQLYQGASGAEFGEVMGAPEGKGFFWENPFGETVFVYPGSEFLTSALTGTPVPLTGRVAGLNMFGTIVPGMGPAAQIPIGWFLQDKPQLDWWRQQLLPFGGPGADETESIWDLQPYLPTWAKTAVDWIGTRDGLNGGDDRLYASNVMYVATYLHSTGEYDDSIEDQQRLLEDAKQAAGELYRIRAFGQFLLPTAPSFEWLTQVNPGSNEAIEGKGISFGDNLISTRILAEEFYKMQEDDYDSAVGNFLDTFGMNAIGAVVPHSRAVIFGAPTSIEGAQWASEHADVVEDFPFTYGFFAPEGDFDMRTYMENFRTGGRDALEPEQWLMLKDTLLGNYYYDMSVDQLGEDANSPNEDQRAWLRDVREQIEDAYPKWGLRVGMEERPDTEQMIEELYRAVSNPVIRNTEAGQALSMYLEARDMANQQAVDEGYADFTRANDLADTRQWLVDGALTLVEQYPQFRPLWNMVLSRELEEEVEGRS